MTFFLMIWSALWTLFLPLIYLYLRRRGKKDALYMAHLSERFGKYRQKMQGAVWFHAVSLGEIRSAVPLIRATLDRGEKVVITLFTPAGRREAERVFAAEIASGQLAAVWVPLELNWCFKGFFKAFAPKMGLVMEIEIWPRMVEASRQAGVPLYMCNAQYPVDSMLRDRKFPIRPAVMRRFAGAFVKSELQKKRFEEFGVQNVHVTGELRFDQPIPPVQIVAGPKAREILAQGRRVLTFASVTEPEEGLFLDVIEDALQGGERPFFVFVPRAPERFDEVARQLSERGIRFARRSEVVGKDFTAQPAEIDVLLGDSLGEMYFFIAMADRVAVGGGFTPKGSHNIIEPLALGKSVVVGPDVSTIEYPAVEAVAAGVCRQVWPEGLGKALTLEGWPDPSQEQIEAFLAEHSGATARTMAAMAAGLTSR